VDLPAITTVEELGVGDVWGAGLFSALEKEALAFDGHGGLELHGGGVFGVLKRVLQFVIELERYASSL
jgi:hypothetical protein